MANNIDRPNMADDDYKRDVVRRIEAVYAEKESEKGRYLKLCQDLNSRVDDILEEAKAKGLPKKALKGAIKLRELDKKADALREALEDDQREILKSIEEALGEFATLPLGAAAVSKQNAATVGTVGKTTVEKGAKRTAAKTEQDATTAAIVGAALAAEDKPAETSGDAAQTDIEDAAKVAEKAEIDAQRKRDEAAFDAAPPVTETNVTKLDPKAARQNRTGGRTKASEAADAAAAKSAERAKEPSSEIKIVGQEPGFVKF